MSQPGDDGFDEPFKDAPDPGGYGDHGFHLEPRILIALIILGLVVVGIVALSGWAGHKRGHSRLKSQREASAEAIYKSVRWYLDRALKSSGAVILERAREVSEVLEARLGLVLALNGKPGKIIGELDTALEGKKSSAPADPTPKIKVPLSTEAHYLEVWKALQGLNKVWQDKAKVMEMIRAAQIELATPPRKEKSAMMVPFASKPKTKTAKADPEPAKAEPAPAPKPATSEEAPPEPPPPPPPPTPKKGKKLPVHKRNMLA